MTEQEKQPVIQSNDLVNAHYKLDLVEQKLLRFLISMIRPADDKFEKNYYKVEISELLDYLGWEKTGKIYKDIRESVKYLMTRPIKIIKPDETIETTWIASFRYPKNMGWIEFEFSSRLESELLKLKDQFTKYYLKNISKLKSQYSIRLYELLRQYLSIGKREIEIEALKVMLGIEKNEYKGCWFLAFYFNTFIIFGRCNLLKSLKKMLRNVRKRTSNVRKRTSNVRKRTSNVRKKY